MTHTHHYLPGKTYTPRTGTRMAEDHALCVSAERHERAAHRLLTASHPAEVLDLDRRIGLSDRGTTGPARLLVRKLAAELEHGPALAEFEQANRLYWTLVLRWRPMLVRRAEVRSARRLSPLTPAALLAVYYEAAFDAAIRFDPSRGLSFGTYVFHWLRVRESRDIEHLTLVHRSLGRSFAERKMRVLSIEATDHPEHDDGDPLGMQLADDRPLPDETLIVSMGSSLLDEIDASLNHELRVVLARLRLGESMSEAGKVIGLSRERVRQLFEMIRAKVAPHGDDFCANVAPPCRWPKCRKSHTSRRYGLCVEHLEMVRAAGHAEVFYRRVPSVSEVEQVRDAVAGPRGRQVQREAADPCPSPTA